MATRLNDLQRLGRTLVLDKLFDLSLYQALHRTARGNLQRVLGDLIPVETRHFAFWKQFFHRNVETLDRRRRLKLGFLVLVQRVPRAPRGPGDHSQRFSRVQ
jgi:hypothetical protein